MDLTRLAARGVKGFALFPDAALDLQLDTLPEGLVAVVGRIGQGKSTFFESVPAALYGEWPSRPGAFVDSFDARNAFLDVTLDLAERGRYRARVNVDSVARATDAILERTKADGTVERLNDGKVSTFRAAVKRELPSLAVLLASAFAGQKKTGSFARLDRAARRELFAELLGLRHLENYAQTARAAAQTVDKRLSRLQGLIEHLRPLTSDELAEHYHVQGNTLQASITDASATRDEAGKNLTEQESTVAELRERAALYQKTAQAERSGVAALKTAQEYLDRLNATVDRAAIDCARSQEHLRGRAQDQTARLTRQLEALPTPAGLATDLAITQKRIERTLQTARSEKRERIENNRKYLDAAGEIRAEHARLEAAAGELDAARAAAKAANVETRKAVGALDEARIYDENTARAARAAALLPTVPCGGAGAFAACQFLKDAISAKGILADAHASTVEACNAAAVETLEIEQAANLRVVAAEKAMQAWAEQRVKLTALNAAEARVADLQADILSLEQSAAEEYARAEAETNRRGEQASKDRYQLKADLHRIAEQLQLDIAQVATHMAEGLRDLKADVEKTRALTAQTEAQLVELRQILEREAPAAAALAAALERLEQAKWIDRRARDIVTRLEADIQSFNAQRGSFQVQREQRTRYETIAGTLAQDLIEWQALARIFGKEGLQTLEIDAAGPGVSALANDLLETCTGGRFSVELVTQQATTDGKDMKEVFGVTVYDHQRGGEGKDLGLLSGGEEVIVEEALRSAIALHLNQRNVLPIRTCWRDETIGSLDPETAPQYVAMLRRLQARGGFRRVYFITHNLAAAALADAQLVFNDGTVTTTLPPFAAETV